LRLKSVLGRGEPATEGIQSLRIKNRTCEIAQSGGAEQNSVSICIVTLCEATFFNRWSGADGENSNQINGLPMGIEELKDCRKFAGRSRRDSNPRYGRPVYRISSPAHSTTLPPLLG